MTDRFERAVAPVQRETSHDRHAGGGQLRTVLSHALDRPPIHVEIKPWQVAALVHRRPQCVIGV